MRRNIDRNVNDAGINVNTTMPLSLSVRHRLALALGDLASSEYVGKFIHYAVADVGLGACACT